jgi:hypothetical protein
MWYFTMVFSPGTLVFSPGYNHWDDLILQGYMQRERQLHVAGKHIGATPQRKTRPMWGDTLWRNVDFFGVPWFCPDFPIDLFGFAS